MSKLLQRVVARNCRYFFQTYRSKRFLTDRSFRLVNAFDIREGQMFKHQISPEYYHSFTQTSKPKKQPDITKQVLIDTRDNLSDYKKGHINGAVHCPRNRFDFYEYIDTKGGITFDEVYNTMRDIGVNNNTSEIILYDNAGENACRLYFVLRYFGFVNVRILHGGYAGWIKAGLPESITETKPETSSELSLKPMRPYVLIRPTQMLENHKAKRSQIIDTRQPEYFKISSIPRAINLPAIKFMKDGYFKSVQEIRDLCRSEGFDVENNSKGHIIFYSDKGRSSSIAYFALSMVGFDRLGIYDQAISNWILNQEKKLSIDQTEAFQK
eukprot:230234_1